MKRFLICMLLAAQFLIAGATEIKGQDFFNLYIKDKPQGIVRDFYIWQYLQENKLNSQQIQTAYELLNAQNPYLRRLLKEIGKTENLPKEALCAEMTAKAAIHEDGECLNLVAKNKLSSFKTLSKQEMKVILPKISDQQTLQVLQVLLSPERNQLLLKQKADVFTRIYNALSYTEKQTIKPTPKLLEDLSQENIPAFFALLNSIALDNKKTIFKNALLQSHITNAPHNTSFLLGINELRFGSKDKALTYFKQAQKATHSRFFTDRALLWQYLVSQNERYLQELSLSKHVNIFSIYATQKLKKQPAFIIQSTLPNLSPKTPPFDITDPYKWQEIVTTQINSASTDSLKKLIPFLSYTQTMPHLAFIKQRIENFQTNYYIMPFEESIQWDSKEQRNFVFSIAKQESHLIPSLISRSFALGMMQIMPAYIKPFAKEMGMDDIDYHDLFDPIIALKMGQYYIKHLQKEYRHPLFVAYAYNGGPTFLRKLLAKNELFRRDQPYDPWLSMELIPYEETRLYGMRVIANFIIYEQLSGKKININDFLQQTLIYPQK